MRRRSLTRSALLAAFLLGSAAPAFAQGQQLYELSSSLAGASVAVAISSATTTKVVSNGGALGPGGAATSIYVINYELIAGGTQTVQFIAGTKTSTECDTGAVNLSGAMSVVAQNRLGGHAGLGASLFVPAGKDLCIVTVGAGSNLQGWLSYRIK
jgi:hypothetical protein